jgi:hypothetical protein
MKDLLTVYVVASCCITAVLFFGSYWDNFVQEKQLQVVSCSVTINDMARNLNVTLLDMCVLER